MRGPPDLKCERAALAGSPNRKIHLPCTANNKSEAVALQERSTLELQIFCLAHRLAISAPMAASLAPLIWGISR
jgi:hypothetical protein